MVISITIYRAGDVYTASAFGGWYIAHGKTAKDAVKNLIRNLENERI